MTVERLKERLVPRSDGYKVLELTECELEYMKCRMTMVTWLKAVKDAMSYPDIVAVFGDIAIKESNPRPGISSGAASWVAALLP